MATTGSDSSGDAPSRKKSKSFYSQQLQTKYKDPNYICECGLTYTEHKVFFAGMITNKPISLDSSTTSSGSTAASVFNHLPICSNPIVQLKCHNREPGYPSVENTLSYGAPSWRWQILAAPFVDHRVIEFTKQCGSQKRTPIRRFFQFIKLAIEYNKTKLKEGETPLKLYFVGDITPETFSRQGPVGPEDPPHPHRRQ